MGFQIIADFDGCDWCHNWCVCELWLLLEKGVDVGNLVVFLFGIDVLPELSCGFFDFLWVCNQFCGCRDTGELMVFFAVE